MRRAHPSRELRTLSFTVSVTPLGADSATRRRQRVYTSLPGRLRVESLPPSRRAGYVRQRHRVAMFDRGRRVGRVDAPDLSTLVAYDLFAQSIDTTIMWLDSARVRFGLLRLDELDGRRAWVVGAMAGDLTSAQFWVDAEEWRVVRVIQREPWNGGRLADLRFTGYTTIHHVPVPTRVILYRGDLAVERHDIAEIVANRSVPGRAFDLARWWRVQ